MLMSMTHFIDLVGDELSALSGKQDNMRGYVCGIPEPSCIWELRGRDVTCVTRNSPGRIPRDSITSPNVVGAGAAATSCVCTLLTARTFHLVVTYFFSLQQM